MSLSSFDASLCRSFDEQVQHIRRVENGTDNQDVDNMYRILHSLEATARNAEATFAFRGELSSTVLSELERLGIQVYKTEITEGRHAGVYYRGELKE